MPLAGTPATKPIKRGDSNAGPMILATGNRRPHKNWDRLVRALALVDENVRPRLVVTGSHGDDPLRPVVDELGLGRWVDLKSWVSADELADLYAGATVLVMPSFCDGFSLPALEAMMEGVPVMLSDISVYREVAGDAALYFEPTSHSSIADAITTAVTKPDLLAELRARGFDQAAKFSWQKTAAGTVATFDRALGRR